MNCADLEILLCDYVDGTLSGSERATVDLHLVSCAACRELVEDARAAVVFMERAAEVEPPPALVNRILFEARAGHNAPVKKNAGRSWLAKLFEPVLQPKFAMGMAMTILSFSMLGRFAGIPVRELKPSDLEPARLWATLEDKAWRTWERARKYYESLRLVYEVQQTLKDWKEADEGQAEPGAAPAEGQQQQPDASLQDLEGPIPKRPEGESRKDKSDGRVTP